MLSMKCMNINIVHELTDLEIWDNSVHLLVDANEGACCQHNCNGRGRNFHDVLCFLSNKNSFWVGLNFYFMSQNESLFN